MKHLSSADTAELFGQYVIPNYTRYPINLVKGEGSLGWDSEGREYLTCFPAGAAIYWGTARHGWWTRSGGKSAN